MQYAGLLSLGVPGVPWHTQILADRLTLFQPGGTDYAHHITASLPRFENPAASLERELVCFQSLLSNHFKDLSKATDRQPLIAEECSLSALPDLFSVL